MDDTFELVMNTCELNTLCFQTLIKSFEVCDLPVRAAAFVPRKNWIITGSVSYLLLCQDTIDTVQRN